MRKKGDLETMTTNYNMIAGIDIGNGYCKVKLSMDGGAPEVLDLPSQVSYISNSSWLPVEPDDTYMEDIVNELDADVNSNGVKPLDRGRVIFGRRSVASGNTPVIFDINDHVPKCDDSLAAQLTCGIVAGAALRKYWRENHTLPEDKITVDCNLGVALPINDFMAYHTTYENMFLHGIHEVHIHNFERDVTVSINFTNVTVLAEGAAAQYAITDLGAEFLDAVIADGKAEGVFAGDVTGEDLVSYTNTIGIDIGEGTVNFPVFRDGRVAVENSSSINKGYGTVLSEVVAATRNEAWAPNSRKDLAEFMMKENPNPAQKAIQAKLQRLIDDSVNVFGRDVIMEFKSVLSRAKLMADVVYVYGGGATSVRDKLYPALVEAAKLDEGIYTPVVYLDASYSRSLNRNGLYMVASMVANQ